MASQFTAGRFQYLTDTGAFASGYRLYTYQSGTTTHKNVYTTSALNVVATYTSDGSGGQYIALNSRGEVQIWLAEDGPYTFVVKNTSGQTVETTDGVASAGYAADVASDALEARLASTASASDGAGMLGTLRAIAGAVEQTLYEYIEGFVLRITDVMTDAQRADSQTGSAPTLDISSVVQDLVDNMPATGGTIYLPSGRYMFDNVEMPNDPKVIDIIGESKGSTFIYMATEAGPIFKKTATLGRITGATFKGFTVVAHPSSDRTNLAHRALNFCGWSNSDFSKIGYQHNGAGSVGVLLYLAASPYLSYQNKISFLDVHQTTGPSRVVYLSNGGTPGGSPNICEVSNCWFYGCSNVDVMIDAGDNTSTLIQSNIFEDCSGATAVVMGQASTVVGNWFELMGENIATNAAAGTDGSGSLVACNYFSDSSSFIDTITQRPLWLQNVGPAATSITGAGATQLFAPYEAVPSAPTVSVGSGTLTLLSANARVALDATGRHTRTLYYNYTPAATGLVVFTLSAIPAGYVVEQATVASFRGANGYPEQCGFSYIASPHEVWVDYATADLHDLQINLTLKKSSVFS